MSDVRIGIDGYNLAMPNGTGVATYGMTLARILAGGGHGVDGVFGLDAGTDPALRETAFFEALAADPATRTLARRRRDARRRNWTARLPHLRLDAADVPLTDRVEKRPLAERLPPFDRIVTRSLLFEIALAHFRTWGRFVRVRMADPPAIMHWTYPVPVTLEGARNVYTLHDLVPLKLPYTTRDAKAFYRRLVARCIAEAARICTVSEASRADILAEFDADPARIINCYQASPLPPAWPHASAAEDAAAVARTFGLPPHGYFLFFGAVEPKKNIGRLLEAFLALDTTTPLVLAGGRSWSAESELALLPEVDLAPGGRLEHRVRRLPHLPRHMLLKVIRSARAVLFPSLYEGFGLPVLEAMQLGTPVLTSRTSSLPEVAGDAALLIDPYRPDEIAAGLRELDSDAGLRARLSAAGLARAPLFGEDRYRERLNLLYAAALASRAA